MLDVDAIQSACTDFGTKVSRSPDGDEASVEAAVDRLEGALNRWLADNPTPLGSKAVLTRAEDLILALRDIHPGDFPQAYREEADWVLAIMEEAVESGMDFDVEPRMRGNRLTRSP